MSNYLGYSVAELEQFKGFWTAKEIEQQPECWRETKAILEQNSAIINDFMTPILAHRDLRIVLTGAGTSAFVGRSFKPYFNATNAASRGSGINDRYRIKSVSVFC